MGYDKMTPVQAMTIRPGLAGKDIVAQAKTGTGKTIAFLLPVIQRIIEEDRSLSNPMSKKRSSAKDVRAIVLSPTRELAEQIAAEARRLVRGTGVIVQAAVGGTQKNQMLRKTREEGCHLLVATPGRLLDILSDPTSGIDAPRLAALVLDEADRMLDVGFEAALQDILRMLPSRSEHDRQTLLYSATIPTDVVRLAKAYVNPKNFEFVQTVKEGEVPTHEKVPQYIVPCNGFENLFPAAYELMVKEIERADSTNEPFKAIMFLPTTASVQLAYEAFSRLSRRHRKLPHVLSIHSKLTQRQRTASSDRFRQAQSAILISSDVTARGMDFPNVSHVIQVIAPSDREQYIHRIGRTGRADKNGQAWLFVPRLELNTARSNLHSLPIKRHDGLQAAMLDLTSNNEEAMQNPAVRDVLDAMRDVDDEAKQEAYLSIFGSLKNIRNKQEYADALHDMTVYGWGMPEPPAIPESLARMRNLHGLRGVNIVRRSSNRDQQGPARGRRDGFRGRDGGFQSRESGRGRGRSENSPWEQFESRSQRDGRRTNFRETRAPRATF
ncbi:hypothetical protein VTK73DRAFT_7098 [Phialemonium thermophilum]|uniref:ATP-dependent RNA helicase n=1 Tax=Phialemonium thermophilum TaxID=223376 RepID=A0ABR3XUT7_9PEZI